MPQTNPQEVEKADTYRCASCDREFKSHFALLGHTRVHNPNGKSSQSKAEETAPAEAPKEAVGRLASAPRTEEDAPIRLVRTAAPNPLFGEDTGLSVRYAPFEPDSLDQLEEVPIRYGATAGTFFAESEETGVVVSFLAGSLAAAKLVVALAGGEEPKSEKPEITEESEGEEQAPAEDEAISEVVEEVEVGEDRVKRTLTEARTKAEAYANESEQEIIERFWSSTDQRILTALFERGVELRPSEEAEDKENPTKVETPKAAPTILMFGSDE